MVHPKKFSQIKANSPNKSVFELGICQTKKHLSKSGVTGPLCFWDNILESFSLTIAYKRQFLNSQENSLNTPD
jgi:hypothetical protein